MNDYDIGLRTKVISHVISLIYRLQMDNRLGVHSIVSEVMMSLRLVHSMYD